MQLLADQLVELKVVETISDETVRLVLKKAAQAVAEGAGVHPDGLRPLRLCDGGGAGHLCAPLSVRVKQLTLR